MNFNYFNLAEGDTVINLGAHRGNATKIFSELVGETGLVISVEPIYENYCILVNNVKEWKLDNVITLNVAVSQKSHHDKIYLGSNSVNHSMKVNHEMGTQRILTLSWDDIVDLIGLTKVTLTKIDVEGMELETLNGMTHKLPKHMMIEDHSRFAYPRNTVEKLLEQKGYTYERKGLDIYARRKT